MASWRDKSDNRVMHRRLVPLAVVLALLGTLEAQTRPRPRVLGSEWTSLFNGKDLEGLEKRRRRELGGG